MNIFNKNKIFIGADLISEELKQAREAMKLSIKDIARELKIRSQYLEYLELGRFDKLPAGVYGKNFLREYALFLNRDADKLISIYNNEVASKKSIDPKILFTQKVSKAQHFLMIPKIIKTFLIVLAIFVCASYLVICLNKIISAPKLSVMSPSDNLIIKEHSINIEGLTEPEADISINGELVLKNTNGSFEKKIDLKSGMNIISITAQKKYSRINVVTKKILVNDNI
jgi:transcriptional regulator with XRE-family HTH domain